MVNVMTYIGVLRDLAIELGYEDEEVGELMGSMVILLVLIQLVLLSLSCSASKRRKDVTTTPCPNCWTNQKGIRSNRSLKSGSPKPQSLEGWEEPMHG